MSDDAASAAFLAFRFGDRGPVCPHADCKCDAVYVLRKRRIFKCKRCERQFSATSGTIFASRKMSLRDILMAILLFVNGANGHSALRLSRDLRCDYKTAFVLEHKLREVMGALRTPRKLSGFVEIDGAWFGGHIKPKNVKAERSDRRLVNHEKRRSIVTMRERRRGGRTLTFVFKKESEAIAAVLANVHISAKIRTDEAAHWNILDLHYEGRRTVNHSKAFWEKGIHTNWVESANSRYRRAEIGVHHHIAGPHLAGYANEFAWREDHRRVDNGTQWAVITGAAARQPVSRDWKGYWQRRKAA
jgi:transposase-like protein